MTSSCTERCAFTRVTLYTAGHLHTAVPHCSHSRAPIVHTAVPRENNEHGCVYLRCRAVRKLPGCVGGHPCLHSGHILKLLNFRSHKRLWKRCLLFYHGFIRTRTWISNYIHSFLWDVVTHPCLNFKVKPLLKLGHGWVITPPVLHGYNSLCMTMTV